MKFDIVLITDSKGKIPQKKHETESLDLKKLVNEFEKMNYNVTLTNYFQILNSYVENEINGKYFFYASSQYSIYKDYITDCLNYVIDCGGIIIPSKNLFIAHENKAFQELEKKRLNIPSPNSLIIGTIEEGIEVLSTIKYPFVAKTSTGFSSKGVSKINNKTEGKRFLKNNMKRLDGEKISHKTKHMLRKLKFKNSYPIKTGKIIFQDLINDLTNDWKVLIFHDRIFTLKRFTKKGDFKASGSGLFDFEASPPKELLDFALKVCEILQTPFASLDIVIKDKTPYLIEYQSLHFGLTTMINGKKYYILENNEWKKREIDTVLEYNYAYAIHNYIHNNCLEL